MAARMRRRGRLWLLGKLLSRLLLAGFLVFATYNPTGTCFYGWAVSGRDPGLVWKIITAALLVIGWGILAPVVWRALGGVGIALATGFATSLAWVLMQVGWLDIAAPRTATWTLLAVASFVLGVGLTWLTIGRALDGQLRTVNLTR